MLYFFTVDHSDTTKNPAEQAEGLAEIVRDEIQNAMTLNVPLKVDVGIGANWLEAK